MTQIDLPARPDQAPTPKKRNVGAIIAAVIGGLIVLSVIASLTTRAPAERITPVVPIAPMTPIEEPTYEVSAELVVDTMAASQITQFCTYYAQLGDSASYAAFAEGYGTGLEPSAAEVFDELVGRC